MTLGPSWTVFVCSRVFTAVVQLVVIYLVVLLERFYSPWRWRRYASPKLGNI